MCDGRCLFYWIHRPVYAVDRKKKISMRLAHDEARNGKLFIVLICIFSRRSNQQIEWREPEKLRQFRIIITWSSMLPISKQNVRIRPNGWTNIVLKVNCNATLKMSDFRRRFMDRRRCFFLHSFTIKMLIFSSRVRFHEYCWTTRTKISDRHRYTPKSIMSA